MTTAEQRVELTPERLASKDYPKIAFYLSSISALFLVIAGFIAIFFDSLYLAIAWSVWAGLTSVLIGIALIICSVIIGGAATTLVVKPEARMTAGATIIVVSLLALLLGLGWFWLIGSGLGIIGGILALVWRPTKA